MHTGNIYEGKTGNHSNWTNLMVTSCSHTQRKSCKVNHFFVILHKQVFICKIINVMLVIYYDCADVFFPFRFISSLFGCTDHIQGVSLP